MKCLGGRDRTEQRSLTAAVKRIAKAKDHYGKTRAVEKQCEWSERVPVLPGGIALVLLEAVAGVARGQATHQLVAVDLRQDRRCVSAVKLLRGLQRTAGQEVGH